MRVQRSPWLETLLVVLAVVGSIALGLGTVTMFGGGAARTAIGESVVLDNSGSTFATPTLTDTAASSLATSAPSSTPHEQRTRPTLTVPPASQPAQERVFINETFEVPSPGFPNHETDTWSAKHVDQGYQLKLFGQMNIGASLALPAENYRLSVDIAVVQGGAGIVFLFREPATSYRIILSSDGAYAVQNVDNNTTTQIVDWTATSAVEGAPGVSNRLTIERRGQNIQFFANNQLLTDFTVPPGEFEPTFGLVLTSRSAEGEATFDNLRGEAIP